MTIFEGKRSDYWQTPDSLYATLNSQYAFGVDLACNDTNNKAFLFLHDALPENWVAFCEHRTAWLNPPFSKAYEFFEKLREESTKGLKCVAIYKNTGLETATYQDCILPFASWIFIIRGRTNYFDPSEPDKKNVPFGSILIGYNVPPPHGIEGTLVQL